jgi:hypothetical protein
MLRMLLYVTLVLLTPTLWAAPISTVTADFDGDGRQETITLEVTAKCYTLTAGARTLTIQHDAEESPVDRLQVVDIDPQDGTRQLAVYARDVSHPITALYRLDARAIHRIGEYQGEVEIPGNGSIREQRWQGFWMLTEKYLWKPKTGTLVKVAQPFYYVGVEGAPRTNLPIYAAPAKKEIVARLTPQQPILILLNKGDWYLVKSHAGLTGWLPADTITFEEFADLPWGG